MFSQITNNYFQNIMRPARGRRESKKRDDLFPIIMMMTTMTTLTFPCRSHRDAPADDLVCQRQKIAERRAEADGSSSSEGRRGGEDEEEGKKKRKIRKAAAADSAQSLGTFAIAMVPLFFFSPFLSFFFPFFFFFSPPLPSHVRWRDRYIDPPVDILVSGKTCELTARCLHRGTGKLKADGIEDTVARYTGARNFRPSGLAPLYPPSRPLCPPRPLAPRIRGGSFAR